MLIDDWAETLRNAPSPAGIPKTAVLADIVSPQTQRFLLSPLAAQTAAELARHDAIERSRDHIFAPARATWLEWRGRFDGMAPGERHGLMLRGAHEDGEYIHSHGSIITGVTTYVFDLVRPDGVRTPFGVPFEHDFAGESEILSEFAGGLARQTLGRAGMGGVYRQIDRIRIGDFLAAACALIGTPRLTDLTRHDQSRVNKARLAHGRPALLSYEEATLNLDDTTRIKHPHITGGDGVALHHVRSHLRLKLGRVELVRPHWRGDPERGIILRRHRVTRAEDEPGEWSGEPLPGPQILSEIKK